MRTKNLKWNTNISFENSNENNDWLKYSKTCNINSQQPVKNFKFTRSSRNAKINKSFFSGTNYGIIPQTLTNIKPPAKTVSKTDQFILNFKCKLI